MLIRAKRRKTIPAPIQIAEVLKGFFSTHATVKFDFLVAVNIARKSGFCCVCTRRTAENPIAVCRVACKLETLHFSIKIFMLSNRTELAFELCIMQGIEEI